MISGPYEVPWSEHLTERAESIALGMTVGAWDDVHPLRLEELRGFLGKVGDIT